MPQFKLKDLFVLTAIVAAGLGILRFAIVLYRREELAFSFWLFCGGAFVLFVAPAMYWGSIRRRGKNYSLRDTRRRLNFWSGVLLVVTLFAGLSFLGAAEPGVSPGWRIGSAIVAVIAGLTGGTLGTIAQRLKKREYWEGAPPHSWTPRLGAADDGEAEKGKQSEC